MSTPDVQQLLLYLLSYVMLSYVNGVWKEILILQMY